MHKVGRKFPLTKKAHTHKHVHHECYFSIQDPNPRFASEKW